MGTKNNQPNVQSWSGQETALTKLRNVIGNAPKTLKAGIVSTALILQTFNACAPKEHLQQEHAFEVQKGQTFSWIVTDYVRNNIDTTYVPTDDYEFHQKLLKVVEEDNKNAWRITDPAKIHPWDTIIVDSGIVAEVFEDVLLEKKEQNKNKKEKIDSSENQPITATYSHIGSISEFANSNNYLVKKLYRDPSTRKLFEAQLKNGYSVIVPHEIEDKSSKSLSVDEITAPEKIVDNSLKWKTFVLDPGHWSMDTGAIGFAQYGDKEDKKKVTVYEAPVMMDIAYRVGKLIREHWGNVVLTHHANKRWIANITDLPPVSRVFNKEWSEVYQDIWHGTGKESTGDAFNADWKYLQKRANISNNTKWANLFLSLHADIQMKGWAADTESKILTLLHQEWREKDKALAWRMFENGLWYYYNWKLAWDIDRKVSERRLSVLKNNTRPALLIELANMSQENQAYYLRTAENRQRLAQTLVDVLIKTYN